MREVIISVESKHGPVNFNVVTTDYPPTVIIEQRTEDGTLEFFSMWRDDLTEFCKRWLATQGK